MEPFTATAFELVATHGLSVLFLMAVAETCFVTGLVVPSGVATSIATVLALQAGASVGPVVAVAALGGFAGDSVGFWVGRRGGEWLRDGRGWAARLYRRHARTAAPFFGRHPVYSVTVARLVSFVRTLMPMAAGTSPLRYRAFVAYEIPGVVGWALMYAAVGFLARESWRRATSIVGVGWTAVFVVAGLALWIRTRRRRRVAPADGPTDGSAGGPADGSGDALTDGSAQARAGAPADGPAHRPGGHPPDRSADHSGREPC